MPIFTIPYNQAGSTLASPHVAGDNQLVLVSVSAFGTPSTDAPIRVTCIPTSGPHVIFLITSITGNILNIASVLESTTDVNLPATTPVQIRISAGYFTDLYDAIDDISSGSLAIGNPISGGNAGDILTVDGSGNLGQVTSISESHVTNLVSDLNAKAPLASPTFSGTPTAPTATSGTNTTQIASTAFVKAQNYLTGNQTVTLSGDVSGSGATAITTSIGAGKVTNSMLAGSITASKLVGTDITIVESQVTNLVSDLAAKAPLVSPTFTGTPLAPTATSGTNTTQLATTAFVQTAVSGVSGGNLTVGTSTITSGTNNGVLLDVSGILETNATLQFNTSTDKLTIGDLVGGDYWGLSVPASGPSFAPEADFVVGGTRRAVLGHDGGSGRTTFFNDTASLGYHLFDSGSAEIGTAVNTPGSNQLIVTSTSVESTVNLTAPTIKLTTGATNNYVLTSDASGNGTWQAAAGGGSGTVTSVAITVPSGLTVSGSPITGSGTLAISTSLSGIVKGTGSGFTTATAGTDFLAPSGNGSALTGITESQVTNLVSDLAGKAPLASPALTGTPTSPTATSGTNTTQIASTAFVASAISPLATNSAVVHLTGSETISGAKTFSTVPVLGTLSGILKASSGTITAGTAGVEKMTFVLARGADLTNGTNITTVGSLAAFSGTLVSWCAKAATNGSSGGFSFQIKQNGTNIFTSPISVAASTTTVQTGSTFASTTVSAGDEFTVDISGAGTGVQYVNITLGMSV